MSFRTIGPEYLLNLSFAPLSPTDPPPPHSLFDFLIPTDPPPPHSLFDTLFPTDPPPPHCPLPNLSRNRGGFPLFVLGKGRV